MIPMKALPLKKYVYYNSEDTKAYALLYHFQLDKIKRPAIPLKTNTISRNLTTIFKKSNSP